MRQIRISWHIYHKLRIAGGKTKDTGLFERDGAGDILISQWAGMRQAGDDYRRISKAASQERNFLRGIFFFGLLSQRYEVQRWLFGVHACSCCY